MTQIELFKRDRLTRLDSAQIGILDGTFSPFSESYFQNTQEICLCGKYNIVHKYAARVHVTSSNSRPKPFKH
jgi:hypothetical protein